jgi:hypothetical protein
MSVEARRIAVGVCVFLTLGCLISGLAAPNGETEVISHVLAFVLGIITLRLMGSSWS